MSFEEGMEASAPRAGTAEVGDLWRILWNRRRLIAGVVLASFLCGSAYVVVAPPQYAATSEILIDPRDRQIFNKDVNPDTLSPEVSVSLVESQLRVITSDTVLMRTVHAMRLDTDPDYGSRSDSFFGRLAEDVLAILRGDNQSQDPAVRALRVLQKHISVKRADKVFVIDATVTAKTAQKAATLADAVAEAYLADQAEARAASSKRASQALAAKLADMRNAVQEAESKVEQYKAKYDIVGSSKELVSDLALDDAGTKLANATAATLDQRARLNQIETFRRRGIDSGALPEALQSTTITQLRTSYADLQRREIDLRTRVGDRHPDLIALVAQLNETRRQINTELARLEQTARANYDRALANEKALRDSLDVSKRKTLSTGEASVDLRSLEREADARRTLYQSFLARADETNAQANIDTSNARILSKAIAPDRPAWPSSAFILAASIVAGLGLGTAFALIREYHAPSILSVAHLESVIEAPVAGIASPTRSRRRMSKRRIDHAAPQGRQDDKNALLVALNRLCGPLKSFKASSRCSSLFVTSAETDSEARQHIIERIVSGVAESGNIVLLIDSDFSNAGGDRRGLLDVLRGDCMFSGATVTRLTPGAARLGIGTLGRYGMQDIRVEAIDRLLESARRSFDLIVFDGGAFDNNLMMAPLATCVDSVLFIAVQGTTPQQAAFATTEALIAASGRPVSGGLLLKSANAA